MSKKSIILTITVASVYSYLFFFVCLFPFQVGFEETRKKKRDFIEVFFFFLTFVCTVQEYGGNLNEAVNAHFIGDRHMYGNVVHK